MAYSACSLDPPGSGRQDRSSSAPPFLTRFLSGSHISAVFAHFSGLSPLFGSLVAYPVGICNKNLQGKRKGESLRKDQRSWQENTLPLPWCTLFFMRHPYQVPE